jgi:transcriptional regulator with XRE-family HTH domain
MNLNSVEILQERVNRSKEARAAFVSSQIDKGIAYQIRALRDRQELSQERLSEIVGMNQNAISRLESPRYGRPTISTLKRLAAAFDVALIVRFVPFSHLVNWVSGTPFVDSGLSTESMAVPNFDEEQKEKSLEIRTNGVEEINVPAQNLAKSASVIHESQKGRTLIVLEGGAKAKGKQFQMQPQQAAAAAGGTR